MIPDPVNTLTLLVQAAVAIAGFSGVVAVFGRKEVGDWTEIERSRLLNLLVASFSVLFLALAALVLLHAKMSPVEVWQILSGLWSFLAINYCFLIFRRIRRIPSSEPHLPTRVIIICIFGITSLMVVLCIVNLFIWKEFWPFLSAQVWLFGVACYSFARLLLFLWYGRQPI